MIDIAELRRLEAEATPGPWRVVIDDDGNPLSGRPSIAASEELDCGVVHWDGFVQEYWRSARGDKEIHANAALIVAMRNALPELLKKAEAFDQLVEKAKTSFPQIPHGGVNVES